jgi:hypothetical protein
MPFSSDSAGEAAFAGNDANISIVVTTAEAASLTHVFMTVSRIDGSFRQDRLPPATPTS